MAQNAPFDAHGAHDAPPPAATLFFCGFSWPTRTAAALESEVQA